MSIKGKNVENAVHGYTENIVASYTRNEAIKDGEIVELTNYSKELQEDIKGLFKFPISFTKRVIDMVEDKPSFEDIEGRLWDICYMMFYHIKTKGIKEDYCIFPLILNDKNSFENGKEEIKEIKLKGVFHPDDNGYPCITIMDKNED